MGYWNRDLCHKGGESFRCWHEECFPVRLPEWWELAGNADSAKGHVYAILGGRDHMREVVESTRFAYTADDVLDQYRRARAPMTPPGYAWAPWVMGAECAECGVAL